MGRPDLQRFYGSWKDSHTKGIFISIHGFAAETCEEFVKDKPIILCDVNDVIKMNDGIYKPWDEIEEEDKESEEEEEEDEEVRCRGY